jgi:hypothetical protein
MEADVLLDPPALFVRSREESMRTGYPRAKVVAGLKYSLTHQQVSGGAIFEASLKGNTVDVHLNTHHVFYEEVYSKIKKERSLRSADALRVVELLMLAYSRAELSLTSARDMRLAAKLRSAWSDVLTSFFG